MAGGTLQLIILKPYGHDQPGGISQLSICISQGRIVNKGNRVVVCQVGGYIRMSFGQSSDT
jgi:hypothetical protein